MATKEQQKLSQIQNIDARMIFDSLGNPTIEVELTTGDGVFRSDVPLETIPRMSQEPVTLRDQENADFGGMNVTQTVKNIKEQFLYPLIGISVLDQSEIDGILQEVDGTEKFDKYGINAVLPISLACAEAAAANRRAPLWKYIAKLADTKKCVAPVPVTSIVCGRGFAKTMLPFKDIELLPLGFTSTAEAVKSCFDVIMELRKTFPMLCATAPNGSYDLLRYSAQTGIKTVEGILEALLAIFKNQNIEGKMMIGIHCDATQYSKNKEGEYKYEVVIKDDSRNMSGNDLADYWINIINTYPVYILTEPFDPEDKETYKYFKEKTEGLRILTFVDNGTQSNQKLISETAKQELVSGCMLKMNQNGTLTQIINAYREAANGGMRVLLAARRGECNDQMLAHLSVGLSNELLLIGGLSGSERTDKVNELLRIEEGGEIVYGLQDWIQQ